jgi:lambda family phage portal protein
MSIYDGLTRAIASTLALIAPGMAARYLAQHQLIKRAYSAAKTTGSNQMWRPSTKSATDEIVTAWRRTTDRARDLDRNNPLVSGALRRFVGGIVGEGMWPKSKIIGADGAVDQKLAMDIENRWEAWQEKAGADGSQFVDIQRLVARHFILDGEALVHRVRKAPLQLEVLECDYLDSGKDGKLQNGNTIKGGIERNRFGAPVAYWLYQAHPAEEMTSSVRVSADDVLHIYDKQRSGQGRGISHFAPIIGDLFDTLEYQDATLTLARVATAYGIFVRSPNPEDWQPSAAQKSELGNAEDDETPLQYVIPGGIHYLRPGEEVQTVKAEQPGGVYAEFVRSRLRSASSGTGMSYETFSNDYSQVSYSSARQAMIQERQMMRQMSGLLDRLLNIPVYRWFLDVEYRTNGLRLHGYDRDPRKFWRVQFSRPRQEWIDPMKEASAAETRLSIGLETLTSLAESEGNDIDDVFSTRAAEVARMKELGIFQLDAHAEQFSSQSTSTSTSTAVTEDAADDSSETEEQAEMDLTQEASNASE